MKKMSKEQKIAFEQTLKLIDILDYFSEIKKPIFTRKECPFGVKHYELSEATGGLGCWGWNCPLCGEEQSE